MFTRTLLTTTLAVLVSVAIWMIPSAATAQYFYDDTPPRMGYIYPGVPYANRYGPPYYQGYGAPYSNVYVQPFPHMLAQPPYYRGYSGYYYGPYTAYYGAYYGY